MAEEGSFKLRMLAVSPYSRTMVTGQWACLTTASETLPNKALLSLPWPLLPITINPAPISSASSTISSSALPSRRWVSLTVPPDSSILLACCEPYSPDVVEWVVSEVPHSSGPMRQGFLCRVSAALNPVYIRL